MTGLLALLCCIFLGRDIFIASLYSCVMGVAAFNFFTLVIPESVIDTMISIGQMGNNPVIPLGMAAELAKNNIGGRTAKFVRCATNSSRES